MNINVERITCQEPVVDSILFKALKTFVDESGETIEKNQHWAEWFPTGMPIPQYDDEMFEAFLICSDEAEIILVRELPKSNKTDRFISDMMQDLYGDICPGDGMRGSHK